MSIDSDPSLYPFGTPPNVCVACFAAGKSPDSIFLSFNGIIKGPLAGPADPAPPNDIWELPATGGCLYSLVAAGITFTLGWNLGQTAISAVIGGVVLFGGPFPGGACTRHTPNDKQNPFVDKYYGGWCDVIIPTDSDPDSLPAQLDLFGTPAAAETYVSPRVLDADHDVYVVSRRSDATNIHVKIEAP